MKGKRYWYMAIEVPSKVAEKISTAMDRAYLYI